MIRLLVGFILSLYVFSPGGHAHAFQHSIDHAPKRTPVAYAFFDDFQLCPDGLPGARRASEKIKAVEIQEDDEPGSSRKHPESRNPYITLHSTLAHQCAPRDLKRQLPLFAHSFSSSSHKFIVHRVIRI